MNQWSRTRKRIILGIVILFVVVMVGIPMFLLFYKAPTCFDGKMNGDEAGIDCGGSCQLLCSSQSLPLLLKGDPRVLKLSENAYQVVALVENANTSAEVYRASYMFKIYDALSPVPLKTIENETFVPSGGTFAVFEGPLRFEAGVVPVRATLEWREPSLIWRKPAKTLPELEIRDTLVSKASTTPRLDAVVKNLSLEDASNIDLTALISDKEGNIFAASKTFVDFLAPGEEMPIVFTWPKAFPNEPGNAEVIIRVFPDRSFIR